MQKNGRSLTILPLDPTINDPKYEVHDGATMEISVQISRVPNDRLESCIIPHDTPAEKQTTPKVRHGGYVVASVDLRLGSSRKIRLDLENNYSL